MLAVDSFLKFVYKKSTTVCLTSFKIMDENTIPALVEKLCRSLSSGKSSETSI